MKSRRGEEGERLRLAGECRELVGVGGEWMFPLVATGGGLLLGGAKMAARTPPPGTADLSLRSLSQAQVLLLPRACGLSCLLSLKGGTGVWCTE